MLLMMFFLSPLPPCTVYFYWLGHLRTAVSTKTVGEVLSNNKLIRYDDDGGGGGEDDKDHARMDERFIEKRKRMSANLLAE